MRTLENILEKIREGATEDLVREATEAFNSLPPAQQAAMVEEQRQSWARSCVSRPGDRQAIAELPADPRVAMAITILQSADTQGIEIEDQGDVVDFLETVIRSALKVLMSRST